MWEAQVQKDQSERSQKIRISQKGQMLNFSQVIDHWIHSSDFRRWYTSLLADSPYRAFYWEVAPINQQCLHRIFEFVLIDSKPLQNTTARRRAFEEHFDTNQEVVAFYNLGRDAQLIVPTPQGAMTQYAHLADFLRSPAKQQIDMFWQVLGQTYRASLGAAPTWLSTAGLGVPWLHARIDSRPKYYRHRPYRVLE